MLKKVELKVRKINSLIEKSIGLLGKRKAQSLLLNTRFGIHTIGLSFPIDIIILDQDNRIIKLKESLKPNKVFFWNPKFSKVVELPAGVIKEQKLEIGQLVEISEK